MTQDEIIKMAQECGLIGMRPHLDGIYSESLVAFANLVAAKVVNSTWTKEQWTEYEKTIAAVEREACAKVCEQHPDGMTMLGGAYIACAAAIRARGEQA